MDPIVICDITRIDFFFITKIQSIIAFGKRSEAHPRDLATLRRAKRMGFSGWATSASGGHERIGSVRPAPRQRILPVYKMIDTCASEFDSYIPYFYSTYEEENESVVTDKPSVVVLGRGPHPHWAGRGIRLFHRARHLGHPRGGI